MTARRIAVVGAGPKGLYCLERLMIELFEDDDRPDVEIHIFEPHPFPGAGPVYDPRQPDFLRMNFANDKINMWSGSGSSFVGYLRGREIDASAGGYAPRRMVGEYLHDGFTHVLDRLHTVATVSVHSETVESINRSDSMFEICTSAQTLTCDEVLVATGHRSRTSPTSAGIAPYPVTGLSEIPAGSTVAVQGLGLTAIDVALALTEGRGGQFIPTRGDGLFAYVPSGAEPSVILPYSRTGRPMTPKPHPVLMPESEDVVSACENGSLMLSLAAESSADPYADVLAALVVTSASILALATNEDWCDDSMLSHVEELLERRALAPDDTLHEMRSSLAIALGRRTAGPDWALGTAWRGIYPTLVHLVATRRLDQSWAQFSALATEMERIAFGPPAENAARLLALVDAGIVDLSCAANPATIEPPEGGVLLRVGGHVRYASTTVDAVLDPPGVAPCPAPFVSSLFEAGLARAAAHCSGLEVLGDGTCIGACGAPTVGLAAVGRPTEGSILGNDTLSRTLHDIPERWARGVMVRAHQSVEANAL